MNQIAQISQMVMNRLQTKNPQGFQVAQDLMKSNGNRQAFINQFMSSATPEQKQNLLEQAKNYGVPDSFLSQLQNMK